MDVLKVILLILHVALAATAFGVSLGPSGSLKRARVVGKGALEAAAEDFRRRDGFAAIAGLFVLASGLGLVFANGGFKGVGPQYHAALGLMLIVILFGYLFMRPTAKGLVASAKTGDDPATDKGIRRAAMGAGIMQLLWLVILVLMFWHRF